MPRDRTERGGEVPSTIRRSDKHAQEIWKETHDSAVETYGEGERAHRTAFASLKHSYKKEGDHWVQKEHRGPSDPQAARGPTTRHKSTDEPAAKTGGGRVVDDGMSKDELYERAKKLDIRGRSKMDKEQLASAVHEASEKR
jgi:cation transport regulator ChaB